MKRAALAALILSALVFAAYAHSWYDRDCCSEQDCHPVECREIIPSPNSDGWFWHGLFFEANKLRNSKDSGCHVCYSPAAYGTHCIYLPGTT